MRVSPDLSGSAIVDELVEQIEAICAVAGGAESPVGSQSRVPHCRGEDPAAYRIGRRTEGPEGGFER